MNRQKYKLEEKDDGLTQRLIIPRPLPSDAAHYSYDTGDEECTTKALIRGMRLVFLTMNRFKLFLCRLRNACEFTVLACP